MSRKRNAEDISKAINSGALKIEVCKIKFIKTMLIITTEEIKNEI